MTATVNIQSVTLPAGEYFVGDPCYAVPDARWMEWLDAADFRNAERYLIGDLDGQTIIGISTAHGDGCYPGDDGNEYPVDAGLIGAVPVEAAIAEPNGSVRATFDQPFECSYENGTIIIGHIEIDTDPDEDEDDYWTDEDEDY